MFPFMVLTAIGSANNSRGGLFDSSGPSTKLLFQNSLPYTVDSLDSIQCRWSGAPLDVTPYQQCACNYNETTSAIGAYNFVCKQDCPNTFPFTSTVNNLRPCGGVCPAEQPECAGFVNEAGGHYGRCLPAENDMNPNVNRIYAYGTEHLMDSSYVNPCDLLEREIAQIQYIVDKGGVKTGHEQVESFAAEYLAYTNLDPDAPGRLAVRGYWFVGGDLPITLTIPPGARMPAVTIIGRKGCTESRYYPLESFPLKQYCQTVADDAFARTAKEVHAALAVFTATFDGGASALLSDYVVGAGIDDNWPKFLSKWDSDPDAGVIEFLRVFSVIWSRIRGPHNEQPMWSDTSAPETKVNCQNGTQDTTIGFVCESAGGNVCCPRENLLPYVDGFLAQLSIIMLDDKQDTVFTDFSISEDGNWCATPDNPAALDRPRISIVTSDGVDSVGLRAIEDAPYGTTYLSPFHTIYNNSLSPDLIRSVVIPKLHTDDMYTVTPYDNTYFVPHDLSPHPVEGAIMDGLIVLAHGDQRLYYYADIPALQTYMQTYDTDMPHTSFFVPRVRFPWVRKGNLITFSRKIAHRVGSQVCFGTLWAVTPEPYISFNYVAPGVIDVPSITDDSGFLTFNYMEIVDEPDGVNNMFTMQLPSRVSFAKQYTTSDSPSNFPSPGGGAIRSYGACGTGYVNSELMFPIDGFEVCDGGHALHMDDQVSSHRYSCSVDVVGGDQKYLQWCIDFVYLQLNYESTSEYYDNLPDNGHTDAACAVPWSLLKQSQYQISDFGDKRQIENMISITSDFSVLATDAGMGFDRGITGGVTSGYGPWIPLLNTVQTACSPGYIPYPMNLTHNPDKNCLAVDLLGKHLARRGMSALDYYRDGDWFEGNGTYKWPYTRSTWDVETGDATPRYEYCAKPSTYTYTDFGVSNLMTTEENYPIDCQPIDVPMGASRGYRVTSIVMDHYSLFNANRKAKYFGLYPPDNMHTVVVRYVNMDNKVDSLKLFTMTTVTVDAIKAAFIKAYEATQSNDPNSHLTVECLLVTTVNTTASCTGERVYPAVEPISPEAGEDDDSPDVDERENRKTTRLVFTFDLFTPIRKSVQIFFCEGDFYTPQCVDFYDANANVEVYNGHKNSELSNLNSNAGAPVNFAAGCYPSGFTWNSNDRVNTYMENCTFEIIPMQSIMTETGAKVREFDQPSLSSSEPSDHDRRVESLLFAHHNTRSLDWLNLIHNYIRSVLSDATLKDDLVSKFNTTAFAVANFNVDMLVDAYLHPETNNSADVDDYLLTGHTYDRTFTYVNPTSDAVQFDISLATGQTAIDRFCQTQEFLTDCSMYDVAPTTFMSIDLTKQTTAAYDASWGYGPSVYTDTAGPFTPAACNRHCQAHGYFATNVTHCYCLVSVQVSNLNTNSDDFTVYTVAQITHPFWCYGATTPTQEFEENPSIVSGIRTVTRSVEHPHLIDPNHIATTDEPDTLTIQGLTNWCFYTEQSFTDATGCGTDGRATLCLWDDETSTCTLRDQPTCNTLSRAECETNTFWSICVYVERYAYDPEYVTLLGAHGLFGRAIVGDMSTRTPLNACVSLAFLEELNTTTANDLCKAGVITNKDNKCDFTSMQDVADRGHYEQSDWTSFTGFDAFDDTVVDNITVLLADKGPTYTPGSTTYGFNPSSAHEQDYLVKHINQGGIFENAYARWTNKNSLRLPASNSEESAVLIDKHVQRICSIEVEDFGYPGQCMADTTQQLTPSYVGSSTEVAMFMCNNIFVDGRGFVDDMVCNVPDTIEDGYMKFMPSARTLKLQPSCFVHGQAPAVPRTNWSILQHLCRRPYRLVTGLLIDETSREELCGSKDGSIVTVGLILQLITIDHLCDDALHYCIVFPDEVKFNTVASIVSAKGDLTGYTIYISPVGISFATRYIFNRLSTDTVLTNGPSGLYTPDTALENDPIYGNTDLFVSTFFRHGVFPLSCIDVLTDFYNQVLQTNGSYRLLNDKFEPTYFDPDDVMNIPLNEPTINIDFADVTLTSLQSNRSARIRYSTECTRIAVTAVGFTADRLIIDQSSCVVDHKELYNLNAIVFRGLDVSGFALSDINIIGADRAVMVTANIGQLSLPSITVGKSSLKTVYTTDHSGPLLTTVGAKGRIQVARCPLAALGEFCELDDCNVYATNWTVGAQSSNYLTADASTGLVHLNGGPVLESLSLYLVDSVILDLATSKCVVISGNILSLGTAQCAEFVNINRRVHVMGNPYFCFEKVGNVVYYTPCSGCDSGYGGSMDCPRTNRQSRILNKTHCQTMFGAVLCTYCGLRGYSCDQGLPWRCLYDLQGSLSNCNCTDPKAPTALWSVCNCTDNTVIRPGYGAVGLNVIENFYYKTDNMLFAAPSFDIINTDQRTELNPIPQTQFDLDIVMFSLAAAMILIMVFEAP